MLTNIQLTTQSISYTNIRMIFGKPINKEALPSELDGLWPKARSVYDGLDPAHQKSARERMAVKLQRQNDTLLLTVPPVILSLTALPIALSEYYNFDNLKTTLVTAVSSASIAIGGFAVHRIQTHGINSIPGEELAKLNGLVDDEVNDFLAKNPAGDIST